MRTSLIVATLCVVGAGAASAGATFATQAFNGSDTLYDLTNNAMSQAGLGNVGDYVGGGSGAGENAMTANPPTQWMAPMSKMMTSTTCGTASGPTHASGIVIGLDGVDVYSSVFSGATAGCSTESTAGTDGHGLASTTTLTYTPAGGGSATLVFKNWTDVLALLYGGLDKSQNSGSGASAVGYTDCNSPQRQALANNWANLFEENGTAGSSGSSCSTNPSSTCTTATFHANTTAFTFGGKLRHAFRRDDASGTSDAFASIIGLGSLYKVVNNAAGAVLTGSSGAAISYSVSASKLNGFGVTPYCNAMNWDTTTANEPSSTKHCQSGAFHQFVGPGGVPQLFCSVNDANGRNGCASNATVGSTCNGTGTCGAWDGFHKRPPFNTVGDTTEPTELGNGSDIGADVRPTAFQDNDPIRRQCVGFSSVVGQGQPAEEVCNIDNPLGPGAATGGQLGLVLPMAEVDWITQEGTKLCTGGTLCTANAIYPTTACTGFSTGAEITVPYCAPQGLNNQVCPDGAPISGGCQVPIDGNGDSFCESDPGGWNAGTDFTVNDARIFNLAVYDGSPLGGPIGFAIPGSTANVSFTGGFARIHMTLPLWDKSKSATPPTLPGGQAQGPCTATDMTDQIACLTQADPCSIGYAGDGGKGWNVHQGRTLAVPGTDAMEIAAVYPTTSGVQSGTYPFWRKLYYNSSNGFDGITATTSYKDSKGVTVDGHAELALGQFESNTTSIDGLLSAFNFFSLGHSPNTAGGDQPYCEDFNENMLCSSTTYPTNLNACAFNANALTVAGNSAVVQPTKSSAIPIDPSQTATASTTSTVCGNGKVEAFEDCDWVSGSTTCSKTCRFVLP